ncbi:MAG: tRNA (N6-threonylcarbamoyladenosine(37)-N6)-methyltransferase TrmO [Thermodesulfobacteriota bacterium]
MEDHNILVHIGVVHSAYKGRKDAPSQGRHRDEASTLEIFERFEPGLKDVESCSHLIVLYLQHQGDRHRLQTRTPWGPEIHGVFATRSPDRPNPIGLCTVELVERNGCFLTVRWLDALDGSPLLDIKPYSAGVDAVPEARIGWHEKGDL